jgi:thiamine-phosphate pyrophosphorylase
MLSGQLYLVTDEAACVGRDFFWVVEEAVLGGVTMVQLREKALGTRAFVEKAKRLKALLDPYGVPLIINDRVDVALAVDAAGVHVGQSDMPYDVLKSIWPSGKMIGLSAETQLDVYAAASYQISYLAVSPLFSTNSKHDVGIPWGIEGLKWVKEHSSHPLVVIGGVNRENAADAARNGASAVAVISAICGATSPRDAARRLKNCIQTI